MSMKSLSTAELRRELERRERGAKKLLAKRTKLASALAALDGELADLGVAGGSARGRSAGRPKAGRKAGKAGKARARNPRAKNKMNLADSLAAAIRVGTVVSPAQAIERVKAAGYKTNNSAFRISVTQTLSNDKRFKRKGHGQYVRVG
ncbi:MAG: hypothetical protein ACT4PU_00495 [Planctomycetota bacterium]